jgi:predicted adenylyl cyclase CyaB
MAHKDTEIEIKIPVSKSAFLRAKRKLLKIAKLIKVSHHLDDYYIPAHRNFLAPRYPYEWLTIRKRDGKSILNFKHLYPEETREKTHSNEYEVKIEGIEQLEKIFLSLNFKKFLSIDKKREVFQYQNKFEIGLDEVKKLGFFIEIECLKDLGSHQRARKELFSFAKNIGLDPTQKDQDGYALGLMKKEGLVTI